MEPTGEQWKSVPGWEGLYEVSDMGRVRSIHFANAHGVFPREPRLRKVRAGTGGYAQVLLALGKRKMRPVSVHRLVLAAFVGPAPEGYVAGHLNGNRADNRLVNLQWVTHRENSDHQVIHGTRCRGAAHPNCKLTEDQVREIRSRSASAESWRSIARRYGVSRTLVKAIVSRERWAWL